MLLLALCPSFSRGLLFLGRTAPVRPDRGEGAAQYFISGPVVEAMSGSTHPVCQGLVLGDIILEFDSLTCWMAAVLSGSRLHRLKRPLNYVTRYQAVVAIEWCCAHLCTSRYLMAGTDPVNAYMYQLVRKWYDARRNVKEQVS